MHKLALIAVAVTLAFSSMSASAADQSEAQAMYDEVAGMIESTDTSLWSTTKSVKGIARVDLMTQAQESIESGDYDAAIAHLELAKAQIELAREQANSQADGAWKAYASALLGIEQ